MAYKISKEQIETAAWLTAISLSIAFFSGVGLVKAYNASLLGVLICLVGFVATYKTAQEVFQEGAGFRQLIERFIGLENSLSMVDALSLAGGGLVMSAGFIVLTKSIVAGSALLGSISGVLIGAGYILLHWVINNTLV